MIKSYPTKADLEAAGLPTTESRLAFVENTMDAVVDGINVMTDEPVVGDAVYIDDSNYYFFKGGDRLNHSKLVAAGLTPVSPVLEIRGDYALIYDAAHSASKKYADVLQYTITAITSTTPTIRLRIQDTSKTGDAQYATNIDVQPNLSSTNIDATTAAEISAAVAAKATELGTAFVWWAYLADADGNKVDSDGTKIIIQCDTWNNYQQYNCSMTGGTIAFTTWGDMPAASTVMRKNGLVASWGNLNVARSYAYRSENGTTPSADVPLSDTGLVNLASFNNSPYCAALRAKYGNYTNYMEQNRVMYPHPKFGDFALPTGKELTLKYANKKAPTKDGSEKYMFPFMQYCYDRSYGVNGLNLGDFFAPGDAEGISMLSDEVLALSNPTAQKMGVQTISNSTHRWFAQRCYAGYARLFSGTNGTLIYNSVNYGNLAQGVALLKIKH